MHRPTRPNVTPPVAALAAMSVALLLCVPAGAGGFAALSSPDAHRLAGQRDAFASLIETLNDAARTLAGVDDQRVAHAEHPERAAWALVRATADAAGHELPRFVHNTPLREALLSLPPPTR